MPPYSSGVCALTVGERQNCSPPQILTTGDLSDGFQIVFVAPSRSLVFSGVLAPVYHITMSVRGIICGTLLCSPVGLAPAALETDASISMNTFSSLDSAHRI